jgi:thiosulfate dehydrogenase [quinone] large subunit
MYERLTILECRNIRELMQGETRMAIEPTVRDETSQAVLIEPGIPAGIVDEVAVPTIAEVQDQRVATQSSEQAEPKPYPSENPAHNLHISDWLIRSREASFLWLVVRLWLGYQWANAGYQKIWGSERSAFWFGGGAGVKGFATAGVLGSTTGKGGASYGWWAAFLHNFVIPNASLVGRVVTLGELLIGVGLILGLFTGAAAAAGLLLNLTYMFSGSAGVNPMFALLSVFLVLAWRNAGWIGLDRFVLQNAWTPHHFGSVFGRVLHRRAPEVVLSQ